MSKNDVTNFGWSERFALIDRYEPSDNAICETFNVTNDELNTARDLRQSGNFQSAGDMDVEQYGSLFAAKTTKKAATNKAGTANSKSSTTKPKVGSGSTSHKKPAKTTASPQTATKTVKEPKKRGRKGTKIQEAFIAIPTTPVSVEAFAAEHNVSVPVLRQSKRFDNSGLGPVKVKKDKELGQLMIWRESAE